MVLVICCSDENINVGLHISVGRVLILALTRSSSTSSSTSVVPTLAAIRTFCYAKYRIVGFLQRYREHQSAVKCGISSGHEHCEELHV